MSTTTDLRSQRLRRGLTLRDLADKCADEGASVHFTHLGRIERGMSVPHPPLRAVLAKLLDLDVNDFDRKAS